MNVMKDALPWGEILSVVCLCLIISYQKYIMYKLGA